MAFIEVTDISRFESDPVRFRGWSIDMPRPGFRIEGKALEIAGWVLGRHVPAVAIECFTGRRVVRRPINAIRPDLVAGFPDLPGADKGGFRLEVPMARIGAAVLEIRAVLRDQAPVPIGRISVRRRWRSSSDPGLHGLVSVVIPCYNQAHYLPLAIESVLKQTHPDVEVVVVDDGSTDNTSAAARRYPMVRCVRQDNQGLAGARNTGLRESVGDYVVFLDADDVLLPEALAAGVVALHDHPDCAFAFGHTAFLMEDGSDPPTPYTPSFSGDYYRHFLAGRTIATPASVIYRRAAFQAVGAFDRTMHPAEDYDLYCRTARDFPVHCHGQVITAYRRHGGNMSSNTPAMLKATVSVLRRERHFIGDEPGYRQAYQNGIRYWKRHYSELVARGVQEDVQEQRWNRAARGLATLVHRRPSAAAQIVRSSGWITPIATPYDPDPPMV